MAHRHTVGVSFTGMDVPDGPSNHYHMLSGNQKTSSNPEGPGHTHTTPDGRETSGPIPLDDDDEEGKWQKKSKKKKKKTWKY